MPKPALCSAQLVSSLVETQGGVLIFICLLSCGKTVNYTYSYSGNVESQAVSPWGFLLCGTTHHMSCCDSQHACWSKCDAAFDGAFHTLITLIMRMQLLLQHHQPEQGAVECA